MIAVSVDSGGKVSETSLPDDQSRMITDEFNLEALDSTLKQLSIKNYWTLYDMARSNVHVDSYRMKFNDFKQEIRTPNQSENRFYSRRIVYYVDYQFIASNLAHKYRNSNVYNQPVGMKIISENPSIFRWNFLLLIDGQLITTSELLPMGDHTCIIIDVASSADTDGISQEQYLRFQEENPDMEIRFVPNYQYATCVTNKNVISSYENKIPLTKLANSDDLSDNTLVFYGLISNDGSISSLTNSVRISSDEDAIIFDSLDEFRDIAYIRFFFLDLAYLYDTIRVSNTENYFMIDTKSPCPIENLVIKVTDKDGQVRMPYCEYELFYPNIYQITSLREGETAEIYVLYKNFSEHEDCEDYYNQLELYEKYRSVFPEYKDGTIPVLIKDYKPVKFDYSIKNYDDRYDKVSLPQTMTYKIETLQRAILDDPWILSMYLDKVTCPYDKILVEMTKINLNDRIRTDTSLDFVREGSQMTFPQQRYVFQFNKKFSSVEYVFRLFLDGYLLNEYQYDIVPGTDFYYAYILKDLVKPDSVLDVERYTLFNFKLHHTFNTSDDDLVMTVSPEMGCYYAADLFLVDVGTSTYLYPDQYKIQIYNNGLGDYVEVPATSYCRLGSEIKLSISDTTLIGKDIMICIRKQSDMLTGPIHTSDDPNDQEILRMEIPNTGHYNPHNYRVFKNGQLLYPETWDLRTSSTYGESDILRNLCLLNKGDRLVLDHIPTSFRLIYIDIKIDKKGYIDVDGELNLPLNFEWYDFYLNGRKLNKTNATILSPTRMYIKGVTSRDNFMIYARERADDMFYLAPHKDKTSIDLNNTLTDKLFDEVLKDIIDGMTVDIEETQPNVVSGQIFGKGVMDRLEFFHLYLEYHFISANYAQLKDYLPTQREFKSLLNEQGMIDIPCNINVDTATIFERINCNKGVTTDE